MNSKKVEIKLLLYLIKHYALAVSGQLYPPAPYLHSKSTWYPMYNRLHWFQSRSGNVKVKILDPTRTQTPATHFHENKANDTIVTKQKKV
jgi:hypothetical protein